jgi:hypothetical protein
LTVTFATAGPAAGAAVLKLVFVPVSPTGVPLSAANPRGVAVSVPV